MPLATAASGSWADPREFQEVYRDHHGFVWHALHRFGLYGAGLEDALQDVFVVAYRRREAFSGSTKAWLYAIARRVASNHRRSVRRRDAKFDALSHVETAWRTPIPEAVVALDRYLAGLSDEDRELFVLSEVEGMTGPEIAAAWDRNLNTVYTRIRKLRASLHDGAVGQRVRQSRPAASTQAWAALLPCLKPGAVAVLSGVSAGWLVGVAAASLGVVAIVGVAGASEPSAPRESTTAAVSPGEDARERQVSGVVALDPAPGPPRQPAVAAPAVASPARSPAVRPRPATDEPAPAPASTLGQENALLEQARAALRRGDAEAALRHTGEHATRFPEGALSGVRAIVRIEALCALDKQPQARAEAKLLLQAKPSMTSRRRLEKSCAVSPQNSANPDMTGP